MDKMIIIMDNIIILSVMYVVCWFLYVLNISYMLLFVVF